jgi:hypothetical protein
MPSEYFEQNLETAIRGSVANEADEAVAYTFQRSDAIASLGDFTKSDYAPAIFQTVQPRYFIVKHVCGHSTVQHEGFHATGRDEGLPSGVQFHENKSREHQDMTFASVMSRLVSHWKIELKPLPFDMVGRTDFLAIMRSRRSPVSGRSSDQIEPRVWRDISSMSKCWEVQEIL